MDTSSVETMKEDIEDEVDPLQETIVQSPCKQGNHAVLAWRTLHWVCSVDSVACSTVQREVLKLFQFDSKIFCHVT